MRQAAVMVIIRDGYLLAISRRHDKTKFGFPGGKKEENETTLQAAIRETMEEVGVQIVLAEHIFTRVEPKGQVDGEDFYCYCYYATAWSRDPRDSEEGVVKWMTQAELTNPDISPFAEYNKLTLEALKTIYPNLFLV